MINISCDANEIITPTKEVAPVMIQKMLNVRALLQKDGRGDRESNAKKFITKYYSCLARINVKVLTDGPKRKDRYEWATISRL